jgi:hypothetical protein
MKSGLQLFLDEQQETEAVFVGVRRTDPYAGINLSLIFIIFHF